MGKKKRYYDAGYKLKVIAYAEEQGNRAASSISALHQQKKPFAIGGLVKKNWKKWRFLEILRGLGSVEYNQSYPQLLNLLFLNNYSGDFFVKYHRYTHD